jgi:hypothetical protein
MVSVGVLHKHVRLVVRGGGGKGGRLVQVIENEVEELSTINRTLNDPACYEQDPISKNGSRNAPCTPHAPFPRRSVQVCVSQYTDIVLGDARARECRCRRWRAGV